MQVILRLGSADQVNQSLQLDLFAVDRARYEDVGVHPVRLSVRVNVNRSTAIGKKLGYCARIA
ncbi:hypothetical protein CLV84_0957 [Neolewinella xylanilytica]|uniref:Uncharacterized protein n=1 Tax=Neolewinella xylanilytica TaxID=1514080 RepID=A0A2S6I927_9BACT|nr:hypothetical protein CLV84_0957 [Neolewinella xylanilytica]